MATGEYLTTTEVAEVFRVAPSTVTRWVRDRKLTPAIRTVGHRLRFRREDIEALRDRLATGEGVA